MSQQAAARRGTGPAGCSVTVGQGKPRFYYHGGGDGTSKGFKSAISKIANNKFNMGQKKFAAQFTQLQKNVANYL
jgi:hypothetical protein